MTREFLAGLNIEEGLIDKIMAEHGKAVQKYQDDAAELKTAKAEVATLKGQLADRDKQLADLGAADVKNLKAEVERLQGENAAAKAGYEDQIEKMRLDHAIERELGLAKAKNITAARALVDMNAVSLKDGKLSGLDDQIKKIKKENEFLFEADGQSGGSQLTGVSPAAPPPAGAEPAGIGAKYASAYNARHGFAENKKEG